MKNLLIIAGFDPSGEAGMIRDFQVAWGFKIKAKGVVTAITAQNRDRFFGMKIVSSKLFLEELKSVGNLSQFVIKVGMLGNDQLVRALLYVLRDIKKAPPILVLDPVFQSTTGADLLDRKGRTLLFDELVPKSTLWTPNLIEASYFLGKKQTSPQSAATRLWEKKKIPVLVKGGHGSGKKIEDVFVDASGMMVLHHRRLKKNIRGTGCTFSTMIACHVAQGHSAREAVRLSHALHQEWFIHER